MNTQVARNKDDSQNIRKVVWVIMYGNLDLPFTTRASRNQAIQEWMIGRKQNWAYWKRYGYRCARAIMNIKKIGKD